MGVASAMKDFDDHRSDLEMLARTVRSTGIDPQIYPGAKKMAAKGRRSRSVRERRFAYTIQTEVTLPRLKFLEGKDP
jgi:hypothetical protein